MALVIGKTGQLTAVPSELIGRRVVGPAEADLTAPGAAARVAGRVRSTRVVDAAACAAVDRAEAEPALAGCLDAGAVGERAAATADVVGERLALAANPRTVVVRTAWLHASWGNNVVRTMLRLAAGQSKLRVGNDQRGNPTSALDLASGCGRGSRRSMRRRPMMAGGGSDIMRGAGT